MGKSAERGDDELARALKQHFGFDQFRPNQREIVDAILGGQPLPQGASSPEGQGEFSGDAKHAARREERVRESGTRPGAGIRPSRRRRAGRPTDDAALLRCPGVGEAKREAYGALFLTAIREFRC